MQYHELRNTKINYTLNNDKIASLIEKIKIQRRPENASNRFYIFALILDLKLVYEIINIIFQSFSNINVRW